MSWKCMCNIVEPWLLVSRRLWRDRKCCFRSLQEHKSPVKREHEIGKHRLWMSPVSRRVEKGVVGASVVHSSLRFWSCSRRSETLPRSAVEVWCVVYIFERSFWHMGGNKVVGGIKIKREGQLTDTDKPGKRWGCMCAVLDLCVCACVCIHTHMYSAVFMCVFVLLYYICRSFLLHFSCLLIGFYVWSSQVWSQNSWCQIEL